MRALLLAVTLLAAGCDKYDWGATLAKLAACAAQSVTPATSGDETPPLRPWEETPDAGP